MRNDPMDSQVNKDPSQSSRLPSGRELFLASVFIHPTKITLDSFPFNNLNFGSRCRSSRIR